ncbi:hypothetical protein [Trueperella pyogenes]
MHVTVLCSGLPGLGPQAVVDCAVAAWRAARPQDVVVGLATSEGIDVAHVGTGLGDVVCFHHPHARAVNLGQSTPRRWWRWDDNALIDLADSCSWTGEYRGSTAFLGEDLRDLVRSGVKRVHLHLPQLMSPTDLGLGMLGELAGVQLGDEPRELVQVLADARAALAGLSMVVTYAADLPLLGINGMARLWAERGFDGLEAQDFERRIVGWVRELDYAAQRSSRRSLLSGNTEPRAGFAGPGGGLGLTFALLGASMAQIGDALVGRYLGPTDLIVYVSDSIGVDLPSGVHAAARFGEKAGIPVVLLTDSAGIRKGELARLGLHGSYELRPERAFLAFDDDADDAVEISRLSEAMGLIATTWGWDT